MKKQLQKKLYALSIAIIFFSTGVNAQIVYTDVVPDSLSTGTYNLDLNNDGITDFVIVHTTQSGPCNSTGHFNKVTPTGSNQVADYMANRATRMEINTPINSSTLTWSSNVNQLMEQYFNATMNCNAPNWIGLGQWYNPITPDGYLGLKLIKDGSTYYGWVRMSMLLQAHGFIVRDIAYNSVPDQPILAGAACETNYNYWNGSASNAWENPANWSCGNIPDANTNVVINSGTVVLNSNTSIYTFTAASGVFFTIKSGFNLNVLH